MHVRLVIDVLDGVVVRGVAGRRDEYRPVQSILTSSTEPLEVARAFRERLGVSSLYVADLDGLVHFRPDHAMLRSLVDDGFDVLADVGVRTAEDAGRVVDTGVRGVVAALESVPSPETLESMLGVVGSNTLVFSLDLRRGQPIRASDAWPESPDDVARTALELGLYRMIVLDLAAVGVGTGVPTLDLCRRVKKLGPDAELVTGGGVRTSADLAVIAAAGIDETLVASAVHDGRIGPDELH